MPKYDFTSQRLFVDAQLEAGADIETDRAQANYLLNVLRLREGGTVLLFNGLDGEWSAEVAPRGRKSATLKVVKQTRRQIPRSDLRYLFAPLKQARMDYMVQKAVEMGVGILQPVLTQYTQLRKVNLDKMRSYAIEAAEQCGILSVPEIREPVGLKQLIGGFEGDRRLIFCDEAENILSPLENLAALRGQKIAVLIGPEGGFSEDERTLLNDQDFVMSIPLGPRILRADTAAVAALAVIQAATGDWRGE